MKYLLLIYAEESKEPVPGTPEFDKLLEGYGKMSEVAEKAGVMEGGQALEPVATATTVRVRNGKSETMDGPFAETKEQLGGFYLLDCKDMDEAIKYAAMVPSAEYGCVEIRPIMVFN